MSVEKRVSSCKKLLSKLIKLPLHSRVQHLGKTQLDFLNICHYNFYCHCSCICVHFKNTLWHDIFSKTNPRSGFWPWKRRLFGVQRGQFLNETFRNCLLEVQLATVKSMADPRGGPKGPGQPLLAPENKNERVHFSMLSLDKTFC